MRTYVIAEGGVAHDGEKHKLMGLIGSAREAGADAFKTQYWSSSSALSKRRNDNNEAVYSRYAIPFRWLEDAAGRCEELGLDFLCTVFLKEDIKAVAPLVRVFKVASPESIDPDFISAHRGYGKKVLLSGGRYDWDTHRTPPFLAACDGLVDGMLHCVSKYPCPIEDACLWKIRGMGFVGWSDHTIRVEMGGLAVAAGASVIEVHHQLMTTRLDNPDGPVAHYPDGLRKYIENIKIAEAAVGLSAAVTETSRCG